MLALFIVAVIVIVILVVLMFFILRGTVKKINSQTKLYFVDKLQEYDYLINEKEDKLNKINEEIKEKELKDSQDDSSLGNSSYDFDYNIIDLLNKTTYQDKNVFEISRKIDEKFDIDYVALLKKFLDNVRDEGNYSFCKKFRDKFSSDEIFKLKMMNFSEQKKYMRELLDDKEYDIYELYLDINDNNDIDGFVDYLSEMVDLNSPEVLVYVGKKEENYDYLSKYVKTVYSKDIYKGIRIVYRNKIYDYSLNERNV